MISKWNKKLFWSWLWVRRKWYRDYSTPIKKTSIWSKSEQIKQGLLPMASPNNRRTRWMAFHTLQLISKNEKRGPWELWKQVSWDDLKTGRHCRTSPEYTRRVFKEPGWKSPLMLKCEIWLILVMFDYDKSTALSFKKSSD